MKQTRPHLQINSPGLVNKYGSKIPKTSQNKKAVGLMAQLSAG